MALTHTAILKASATETPYKLSDGGGLHLLVQSGGSTAEVTVAKSVTIEARVAAGRAHSPGQAGVLAARPEDLRIESSSGSGLAGQVVDGIFLGESTHVRVALDGLGTVRVQWTGLTSAIPRTGQRVTVDVLPAQATFLLED